MRNFLNTTHRNIHWFKQADEQGDLKMKPPFQRNLVWTDRQKTYLIDTILNEYPIPELYMQDIMDDHGNASYIVVDGQQRINACLEFVRGDLVLDGKDSPQWAGMSFDDLSPEDKKKIYRYDFVVRNIPDISDAEIRAIFQRLNRNNVVLNAQELRQATYWGLFIQTMNDLATIKIWQHIGLFTSNDVKRMLDVEFISELSIAILHGLQNKKQNMDRYYKLYEEDFDEQYFIMEVFNKALLEISASIPEIRQTRWSKKTNFYSLFVVLARHHAQIPLSQEKRELLKNKLVAFGQMIAVAVSTSNDDTEDSENENESTDEHEIDPYMPEYVKMYVQGIRASTDLGSRKRRDEALEMELAEVWQ